MPSIIEPLAQDDVENWGKRAVHLHHKLEDNPLFSDTSLAGLIERIPQSVSPINTMAAEGHRLESWSYCDRTGLTGMQVLDAIKRGRLWINMQKLEQTDARFAALLEGMFDELRAAVPGFAPFRTSLGLLISSPGAQVFYHADVPGQSLWQVRGKKRIYLYPANPPFLKAPDLENVIRGVTEEEIEYNPAFDEYAKVVDLEPGDALHWPLNGPHRVENADCLNISLTTEHWTWETRRHFAMNYGNGVLRRELGWTPRSRATRGAAFWAKVGLTAAWRAAGLQDKSAFKRVMRYRVDPAAAEGIVPLNTAAAE
ncbi:MAG: hypothetical protein RLO08_17170 [Parvibaculaceae bacterium]